VERSRLVRLELLTVSLRAITNEQHLRQMLRAYISAAVIDYEYASSADRVSFCTAQDQFARIAID
jgi:hypothetical protein